MINQIIGGDNLAKDGTKRGGVRIGAGRKKKSLQEKIENGNPGGRPLTIVSLDSMASKLEGVEMPPVKEYMEKKQKDGSVLQAKDIYLEVVEWLKKYNCEHLVMQQILEQFVMVSARLIHCEDAISDFGYLIKRANGSAAISPYVTMSNEYRKQANQLYFQIYQVVKENSSVRVDELKFTDDPMEQLLRSRGNIRC